MEKHYLQLEFGKGKFFQYSKEEKEGYERHESKTGKVSYRKYFDEVTGELDSVSVRDGHFGKELSMTLKTENHTYYMPVQIQDAKQNVSTFAEELIKFLPSMEKGEVYTVRAYNFTPEGEEYARIGFSIKDESGEKIERALSNAYYKKGKLVKGDIPAVEWKEDALGKKKPSATSLEEKNNYLLEVIVAQTKRLAWNSDSSDSKDSPSKSSSKKTTKKTTSKKTAKKAEVVEEEDDEDELPF